MTTVKVECDHRFVPKMVRAGTNFTIEEWNKLATKGQFENYVVEEMIRNYEDSRKFAIGVCPKCQSQQEYSVSVNRRSRSPVTTFTPIAK
jgi:hypothetical protein